MKKLLFLVLASVLAVCLLLPAHAAATSKPGWEQNWESTLAKAQKEGAVVIYGSVGGEMRSTLVKSFESKYGVKVEYTAGRGPENLSKIVAQRNAGLFLVADKSVKGKGSTAIPWR